MKKQLIILATISVLFLVAACSNTTSPTEAEDFQVNERQLTVDDLRDGEQGFRQARADSNKGEPEPQPVSWSEVKSLFD